MMKNTYHKKLHEMKGWGKGNTEPLSMLDHKYCLPCIQTDLTHYKKIGKIEIKFYFMTS